MIGWVKRMLSRLAKCPKKETAAVAEQRLEEATEAHVKATNAVVEAADEEIYSTSAVIMTARAVQQRLRVLRNAPDRP